MLVPVPSDTYHLDTTYRTTVPVPSDTNLDTTVPVLPSDTNLDITVPVVPSDTHLDLDTLYSHFVWAYGMVESRAFRPFALTNPELVVLAPVADLMNHTPIVSEVNVKYQLTTQGGDAQQQSLDFVTCRPVLASEPLLHKYNDLTNAQELVYYGFAQPDNPCPDLISLTLPPVQASDGMGWAIKHALLVASPPINNLALFHSVSDPESAANVLLSARVHVTLNP